MKELKEGLQFLENDLTDVKQDVETKADKAHVLELENRITDLQNRSRRNNIVFWNVPEGSEKDAFMVEFVKRSLLTDHMKLEGAENIEIMRAHRTPTAISRDALSEAASYTCLSFEVYRQTINNYWMISCENRIQ